MSTHFDSRPRTREAARRWAIVTRSEYSPFGTTAI